VSSEKAAALRRDGIGGVAAKAKIVSAKGSRQHQRIKHQHVAYQKKIVKRRRNGAGIMVAHP